MSLNPLDLQTMYAQINNVASRATQITQGAELSQVIQQEKNVQKTQEQAETVQNLNESDGTDKIDVNSEGENRNGQNGNFARKKRQELYDEVKKEEPSRLKEDYLGQHIDITR